MAQELRIDTWCDVCLADGQHEPGEPVEVALGGHAPRVLDLCERDRKTYVAPLAELLESLGRRVDAKPTRARAAAEEPGGEGARCIVCAHVSPTTSALGGHLRLSHGATMGEVYGGTCPVCGESKGGTHIARAHGLPGGMVAAYAWARANGDPHGVVAAHEEAAARR